MRTRILNALLVMAGIMLSNPAAAVKDPALVLYTPYTKISVPPGQSIDYTIDVINNSGGVRKVAIALTGIPKDWHYDLKSGGWSISELAVLPGEKKNFSLRLDVPYKVKKGNYRINVIARGLTTLPLTVVVSEEGTFKTEFAAKQSNMEGNAKTSFNFNAELKNQTAGKQIYALRSNAPRGWNVAFKATGRQVSSVQIEPNITENITIEVDPPDAIAAGTYKIPVSAVTTSSTANLGLEVVVTGSYAMELTTPTGLLSTNVTAGDDKRLPLLIKNTGSADLKNIKMSFSAPLNWDVIFEPKEVDKLEPGGTAEVYATIKADDQAIAGDYVTRLEAKVPEVSSDASFRVSVKTPLLYGWIGLMIIGGASSGVWYLFRKFGRR